MLDHTLDELLLAHLKTIPALAALHGYAPLGTEPTAGAARFNTKLKYRFGFGSA